MRKLYFLLLFIIFKSNILFAAESFESKLGYLIELSSHTKYSESTEALELVINDLAKALNTKFHLISYDDQNKIIEDYKNHKIDLLAIGLVTYLKNYKLLNDTTQKFFILTEQKNLKFDSYYLIANNKFKNKSALANGSFVLRKNEPLSNIYLNSLFSKNSKQNISYVEDYNTILLKTYFGEYDACIVPAYSYKILSELNPAIKNKLKIVEESPKIYSTNMILVSSEYDKKNVVKLEDNILELKNSIKNTDIFDLLKIQDIFFIDKSEFKDSIDFYEKNK